MGVTDERVNLRGDVGTGGNNAGDLAKIAIGEPSHMRDIQPNHIRSRQDLQGWRDRLFAVMSEVACEDSSQMRSLEAKVV